jgi:non-ribosomal peptide synthase protein (TIGR01720 family)
VEVAKPTSSFRVWADNLHTISEKQSDWDERQRNYWHNALSTPFTPMASSLLNAPPQTPPDVSKITVRLSPAKTALLLDESTHAPYKTTVQDILLAALLLAFSKWANSTSLFVDMFSDGREKLFSNVDLTRTVGCFVSKYPVALQVTQSVDSEYLLRDALINVKEAVHTVPNQGIGYGIMRCSKEAEAFPEISRDSEVSFRYSGIPHKLPEGSLVSLIQGGNGAPQEIGKALTSKIDVDAHLGEESKFCIVFAFRKSNFQKATIARLGAWYSKELELLLDHLTQNKMTRYATPSDYTLAHLGQNEINYVFSSARPIESVMDVYVASQLQQGMLFHTLADKRTGSYTTQLVFDIKGSLAISSLQRAFAATVHHFPVLRTEYAWDGLNEPHCVVKATAVCAILANYIFFNCIYRSPSLKSTIGEGCLRVLFP